MRQATQAKGEILIPVTMDLSETHPQGLTPQLQPGPHLQAFKAEHVRMYT